MSVLVSGQNLSRIAQLNSAIKNSWRLAKTLIRYNREGLFSRVNIWDHKRDVLYSRVTEFDSTFKFNIWSLWRRFKIFYYSVQKKSIIIQLFELYGLITPLLLIHMYLISVLPYYLAQLNLLLKFEILDITVFTIKV